MKALALEQDQRVKQLLSAVFAEDGYELDIISSKNELLKSYQQENYNIFLLSIALLGNESRSLICYIRSSLKNKRSVILLTLESKEELKLLHELEPDDFLLKPFDSDELKTRLFFAQHILQFRKDYAQLQEQMLHEESMLEILMNIIPDSIYFKDTQSRFIKVSNAKALKHGLAEPALLIGKTDFDLYTEEHAHQAFSDEQEIIRTGKPLVDIEEKETWAYKEDTWVSSTKVPWHDEKGNIIGIIGISRDITKRKKMEEELMRSNKELETFASIASHDLQEPLRKVQAFGERLKEKCHDALDEKGKFYLERMEDAAARMRILINDLLIYSRVTSKAQPFVPVDLNQVLNEVIHDLELMIEQSAAEIEYKDLPVINADPLQMRQLFQNLLSNALKFHQENLAPRIVITCEDTFMQNEGNSVATNIDVAYKNEAWRISVKDNGIGFDNKFSERIFGIFQRLHSRQEYPGTGIGLAVCQKIVLRHGGTIKAVSKLGVGTEFIIYLPHKHTPQQQAAKQ
jgi:PAS domain S-box-containing protein